MFKIKNPNDISLSIPDLDYHPTLLKTIEMYNVAPSIFPPNFLDLIPTLNNFISVGIVNDELISQFDSSSRFRADNFYLHQLRYDFIKEYGFVLLCEKLLNSLAEQLKNQNVLEIGAGTGFLSKQLIDRDVKLTPIDYQANTKSSYDFKIKHTNITQAVGTTYLKNNSYFDSIILSWPDYATDFAAKIVDKIKPNQRLYYVGEGNGGCTGNDRFFYLLEKKAILNEELTNELQKNSLVWPGIHDSWYVYDFK